MILSVALQLTPPIKTGPHEIAYIAELRVKHQPIIITVTMSKERQYKELFLCFVLGLLTYPLTIYNMAHSIFNSCETKIS